VAIAPRANALDWRSVAGNLLREVQSALDAPAHGDAYVGAPELAAGETVLTNAGAADALRDSRVEAILAGGWGERENWGVRTAGSAASLVFRVAKPKTEQPGGAASGYVYLCLAGDPEIDATADIRTNDGMAAQRFAVPARRMTLCRLHRSVGGEPSQSVIRIDLALSSVPSPETANGETREARIGLIGLMCCFKHDLEARLDFLEAVMNRETGLSDLAARRSTTDAGQAGQGFAKQNAVPRGLGIASDA
jgi:hypothetical protein